MNIDVCIVGAGAAGLMAAISSAQSGAKTVVVDSNPNPGRKLLKTGGGRCNITHAHSVDEFLNTCQPYSRFLRHCTHEFSPESLCDFFKAKGIALTTQEDGCVFPASNRASDILRVLVDTAKQGGVEFIGNCKIDAIEKKDTFFLLRSESKEIVAKTVVIATGGKSFSSTGSRGDGYKFAASFGHKIIPPKACLVRLISSDDWLQGKLSGVSLKDVEISFKLNNKKQSLRGAMVFTSNGIGGPVVLNVSREIVDELTSGSVELFIDTLVNFDENLLREEVVNRIRSNPKRELAGIFTGLLPKSLAVVICQLATRKKTLIANQLDKSSRNRLITLLKRLPISIINTRDIEEATVTRGGVSIKEINSKTMQSKIVDSLFFAGEVIDVDGPCGGYNLQIAFSTGMLAGSSAGQKSRSFEGNV